MNFDEELFNCVANSKDIWKLQDENAEFKMSAFRNEAVLLHQFSSETPESVQCKLHQEHLAMLQTNTAQSYFKARASNVQRLLENMQQVEDSCTNYLNAFEDENLEPLCQAGYESCNQLQVTAADLEQLTNCLNDNKAEESAAVAGNYATEVKNKWTDLLKPLARQVPSTSIAAKNKNDNNNSIKNAFRTAKEELVIQNAKNGNKAAAQITSSVLNTKRNFVLDKKTEEPVNAENELQDERLNNIDSKMIELIENEIMHKFKPIDWDEIAGLEYAKSIIKEAVVYPLLRPDIFTGLRRPPRGILLFGPPGTGKTLIGKCIASQSRATFFSISASSLTSKWIGESEKMVRALFAVATVRQPSVVFIDEIDSLLSQRSDTEHESSRRLKTEFLIHLDGAATSDEDRVLIVGATNRPQELDEAARRRLVRRLYIPLPELEARIVILQNLLKTVCNNLNENDLHTLGELTVGYSGADMKSLCHEASMEPIRSIPANEIPFFKADTVRPVDIKDFHSALTRVRPSVSQLDIKQYIDWNKTYGAAH